jgi:DNA helicase-2/ATP-dependent DNA helicase PcrA
LLVGSAEEPGSLKWSFEDLPILCFLELLLNGRSATIYDHMVIDEAQDASPLQVEVLRYHARDGSMTLLGDIAQGVYSYRGIQQWSELREIFQSTHFATAKLAISYRSTYEITVLANRILTRARLPEKIIALPVERHGPPPHLSRCDNWIELVREAITIINDALTNGAHSAAIICKTASICQTFSKTATEIGRTTPTLVLTKASTANPEVMLTPAYLAKGLEFDCVVLAGADAVTFTESEYDAKLVYVSITRALHELHVLWVGEPAILLAPLAVTLNPQ